MLMEIRDRFNSFIIIFQIEFLIWTMEIVAVQSKTHENDLYSKLLLKQRTNWKTTTTTNSDWLFSKCISYSSSCCIVCFAIDRRHIGFPTVMCSCFNSNIRRSNFFQMIYQQISHLIAILVRNKT